MIDRSFTEIHELERGFAQVYRDRLAPRLDDLQRARSSAMRRTLIEIGLLVVIALIGIVALNRVTEEWQGPILFAEILLFAGGFMLVQRRSRGWRDRMFAIIMPEITDFIGNLSYSARGPGKVFCEPFQRNRLIDNGNHTRLEHHVTGTRRGTPFEVVQANIERTSRRSRNVVFKGLLLKVRAPYAIPHKILIARDHGDGFNQIAELFTFGYRRSNERVVFPDETFEARFAVYCADADLARNTITPGLARALITIDDEIGGKGRGEALTAAFDGEWFYMAIPRNEELLALPSILSPGIDIEAAIHGVFADITRLQRVIDRLHGN
ncbi:MAG: DUF3137 domain-containing protein [Salinarimonas sp.]|nr:DUF3137 domain-containing protein [Salinarimonas sp.]